MSAMEKAMSDFVKNLEQTVKKNSIDGDDSVVNKMNEIKDYIRDMKYLAGKWEQNFLQLKHFDYLLHNCNCSTLTSTLNRIKAEIKHSVYQLRHIPNVPRIHDYLRQEDNMGVQSQNDQQTTSEFEARIFEDAVMDAAMRSFQLSYELLDHPQLKLCLLFLSVFPINDVIKKRPLIYWWIGEGLIKDENEGEKVFVHLLKHDLIIPHGNGKSPIVKEFQIHPWIRYMLISLAKNAHLFDFDSKGTPRSKDISSRRACLILDATECLASMERPKRENLRTIFNVNQSYLNFESVWAAQMKKLMVLQLGRWQASPTYHIEVESEAFLKALRIQKHLKYLSLRGVSKITELPRSIQNLVNLEILDLKACHSLESLPDDIGKLRKLTHLDVSECYLLQSMPKGIDKLTSLQVLKGFIIGDSKKNPYRIRDLGNLKKLKRLSIYIRNLDDFDGLENLNSLRCLKLTWVIVFKRRQDQQISEQSFSLPSCLEKLVVESLPHQRVPEWLKPSKLHGLKKLYITGGELNSLDHGEIAFEWKVEILHLNHVKNLKIEWLKLRKLFPFLTYLLLVMPDEKAQGSSQDAKTKTVEWRNYSAK